MDKEIRQILENQNIIMQVLRNGRAGYSDKLMENIINTNLLLNPEETETECSDGLPKEGISFIGKDPGKRKECVKLNSGEQK